MVTQIDRPLGTHHKHILVFFSTWELMLIWQDSFFQLLLPQKMQFILAFIHNDNFLYSLDRPHAILGAVNHSIALCQIHKHRVARNQVIIKMR